MVNNIKPKYKKSSKIYKNPEDAKPLYGIPGAVAPIAYETLGWGSILNGWLRGILSFILLFAVLAAMLYAALSATVAYTVRINAEPHIVARNTFIGGTATPDSILYVSTEEKVPNEFMPNLMQGIEGLITGASIPKPTVVKTIAGPTNDLQWDGTKITIAPGTKKETTIDEKVYGLKDNQNFLKNQYIVECITGDCKKGSLFILPADNVAGELLKPDGKKIDE